MVDGSIMGIEEASMVMKPCRFCELACPVAQGARSEVVGSKASTIEQTETIGMAPGMMRSMFGLISLFPSPSFPL
jgi:hypothetical protein